MFFFKQKTEYELRISDWSSDVCSSDLTGAGEQRQVLDRAASASLPSQALHRPQRRPPVEPERAEGVGVGQPGQRAHRQPAAEIHVAHAVEAAAAHRHQAFGGGLSERSEEHTSELQSLMRISYAVFCLKKKKKE